MSIYSELHEKTKASFDEARAINMKMKMPDSGRYFYIHATISPESIPEADPEDLLVPGLYKVFVPEEMEDGMAARCALEAFNAAVPITCVDTINVAVIDPDSGLSVEINGDELDERELGDKCLGLDQLVAMTYALGAKPYPLGNLFHY